MSKKNKVKAKSKGSEKKAPKLKVVKSIEKHQEKVEKPKKGKKVETPVAPTASTKKQRQAWADEAGRLTAIVNSDAKKKVRQDAKQQLVNLQADIDADTAARHGEPTTNGDPTFVPEGEPDPTFVPETASAAALEDPNAATDAELKARVKAKKAARLLSPDDADKVDRADPLAVWAWNETHGKDSGRYITSDAEKRLRDAEVSSAEFVDQQLDNASADIAKALDAALTITSVDVADEFIERADIIAPAIETGFAVPSDAAPEIERDHLGRPKIFDPETGKTKAYTRVTTFIDNLEDKTALEKWKLRTLLEGVTLLAGFEGVDGRDALAEVQDAIRHRDDELKRIDKRDRKGKIKAGERGLLEEAVVKEYKSTLDSIVHEALEAGGVHEKAQKGTDLHKLAQEYDESGLSFEAWAETVDDEVVTPADMADIYAYAQAMAAAGIKVLECEAFVVNDALGAAGTFDRSVMYKRAGSQRAGRYVADIKTGNVEYGIGKIAQQMGAYANGKGYDPATPAEREDKKLDKKVGLLIHLPQGKAECHIYEVDLVMGVRGNKLSSDVRTWRNESKKAYDLKAPVVSIAPEVA